MNGETSTRNLDLEISSKELETNDHPMNGEVVPSSTSNDSKSWSSTSSEKSMVTTTTSTTSNKDNSKYSVQVVTKFMCRFCARQFDNPTEMQAHIASHSRGKASSHSCYVCGKTYSTPSKLQRHVRVHSGERPYACNICGRRFTRSDHVKQHLKVHMPQKQRNVCRLCDMKFLRRQTLHTHLQQSHGVTTVFTCHRCGEAFDLITQLHAHKESHLSLYPSTEVTEGGVVIKKEPGVQDDEDNPVTGLAKFSLGPQPQVAEDIAIHNTKQPHSVTKHIAIREEKTNGLEDFQLSEDKAMESIIKDAISNAVKNEMELSSYEGETNKETMNEVGYNDIQSSSTLTDGTKMYIFPSDIQNIKKEPVDPEEMEESGNMEDNGTNNDLNKECQTMNDDEDDSNEEEQEEDGISNAKGEKKNGNDKNDEEMADKIDKNITTKDVSQNNNNASTLTQEIKVGPPSSTSVKKIKMIGPASYKAAMQQKLKAKLKSYIPISTIPVMSSETGITSMASTTDSITKLVTTARPTWTANTSVSGASTLNTLPQGTQVKKMMRCEHCCIWFEDYAMSLLHNSLHSADETDPFTCRKCLKKLGNRLEFTAHLVWHLEPTMDG